MAGPGKEYVLAGGAAELERLQLQARVWEPEAEILLDRIGVREGWHCLDLGCGAMGILGPLSRRIGPSGRVLGIDIDPKQLAAARAYVQGLNRKNVEVVEGDASRTELPAEAFDLVHARFLLAPTGRDEEFLREMVRLVRPGGIAALQEPDSSSWMCFPPDSSWDRLKQAVLAAFRRGGGDFDAGRRTYGLLRKAGFQAVAMRAAVLALHGGHPYMRLPILFATSLRSRIVGGGLLTERELEDAMSECEKVVTNEHTFVLTFVITQVWGRKPSSSA